VSKSFYQIAEVIAQKLSTLLQTGVLIRDADQTLIAQGQFQTSYSWSHLDPRTPPLTDQFMKLPFHVQDQAGEIYIQQWVDGEKLSPKLAQAFIDLVVSRVAYTSFSDQQTFKNQVISNLLRNHIQEAKVAQQQANLLGIDFTPPRAVLLIDATDAVLALKDSWETSVYQQQRYSQAIINTIVTFFNLPDDTICADLGGGEFAILKASDSKNLSPWANHQAADAEVLGASWTNLDALKRAGRDLLQRLREETGTALSVGIGRYHPGILGLSRSYQDARVALRLGRQFNGQNQVYCLDDLGIAAFIGVADERTKIELALHLLSPLDNESELINTLRVFFDEDCALSSTARRLCIHRNTLTYRLEKITSLTGLDPRRFDEAVQIRLALLLKALQN
jgi:carbohydrate diacid regulator